MGPELFIFGRQKIDDVFPLHHHLPAMFYGFVIKHLIGVKTYGPFHETQESAV